MSQTYLRTHGSIRAMLNTLFHRPEFWDTQYRGNKYKTPYHYLISAVRATGLPVQNVFPLLSTMQQLGMPLYGCLTPDGYKNTQAAWLNPDALARRLSFVTTLSRSTLGMDQPPPDWQHSNNPAAQIKRAYLNSLKQSDKHPGPNAFLDASRVADTYHHQFSSKTLATVAQEKPALQAALLLGSPERMQF